MCTSIFTHINTLTSFYLHTHKHTYILLSSHTQTHPQIRTPTPTCTDLWYEHCYLDRMEGKELVFVIFPEFMAKVVKLEELAGVGSRLLLGFHQGLEFIRRPPINKGSNLMEHILRSNKTNRLLAYVEAGCVNTRDKVENISNLHTSHLGLYDYLSKAKRIVDELEGLVQKVASEMLSLNKTEPELEDEVLTKDREEIESLLSLKPEVTDYAAMMGIIYSMVKKDFDMQEKIITSLTIKSTSGELESYSMMWSLRPYMSDEIMHQALRLTP